jgi:plasmid maintenance system antidote protein VapI
MSKKEKIEKFLNTVEDDNGSWLEKARYRRENRAWLRKSQRIAVRILSVLDKNGMQQKELAKALDVSPQQVSKIVQGKQNLTLETISKLEAVLDVTLFEVPIPQFKTSVEKKSMRTNLSKGKSTALKSHKNLSDMNMQLWTSSSEEGKEAA